MTRKLPSAAPAPPGDDLESVARDLCRRVKQLRAEKGWSLEALARVSGVSRSMLSQIERNQANPTLAVTLRIARAFGLTLSGLVPHSGVPSAVEAVRAGDRAYHFRSDLQCAIRTLSPLNLEKDVELYEVRLERGGALHSAAHYRGTREFLTVQKGRVRVESGDGGEILESGDSATYRADVAHAIINRGRSRAVVILAVVYA